MKSSFDQLTKRTGLTGVLVGLRSRTFSSMTNLLVQGCHSTLTSNQIIYRRRLNKIIGASTQYRANLDGKFAVESRPADTSPFKSPGETHQEMTELNSRFYNGLRPLLKCGHFHTTQRNTSLVSSLSTADT